MCVCSGVGPPSGCFSGQGGGGTTDLRRSVGGNLRDNELGNAKPRVNAIFYVPGRVGTGTKQGYYFYGGRSGTRYYWY
jgi:hypothetical protein